MNEHQQCQVLLPWYANGTLNEAETARCAAHVAGCGECRADLDLTLAQMRELNQDRQTICGDGGGALLRAVQRRRQPLCANRWPGALAAGIVLTVAVFFTALAPPGNSYRLFGNVEAEAGYFIQVAFHAGTSEEQIRSFVRSSDGVVSGNPTAAGVYRLRFNAPLSARALAEIRQRPFIAWAGAEL